MLSLNWLKGDIGPAVHCKCVGTLKPFLKQPGSVFPSGNVERGLCTPLIQGQAREKAFTVFSTKYGNSSMSSVC